MSAHVKLLELAERGRAASPAGFAPTEVKPVARCEVCGSPDADWVARIPWPAECDVERCGACRSVRSYRWQLSPGLWERRRIACS